MDPSYPPRIYSIDSSSYSLIENSVLFKKSFIDLLSVFNNKSFKCMGYLHNLKIVH